MNASRPERSDAAGTDRAAGASRWVRIVVVAAVLVGAVWAVRHFGLLGRIPEALGWFRSLGPWGAVVFVLAYVLACVCFVPASLLTLGAGAVFGVAVGGLCVSIGATLGAAASFMIGRHLARARVVRWIGDDARFKAVDAAVGREGWKIVLLLRLSPLFPFGLLNYGLGVSRVRLRDFVLASWLGMLPGTVLYVYIGSLLGTALLRGDQVQRERTTAERVFYGIGLLATVVVTVYVTRVAKRALAEKLQ